MREVEKERDPEAESERERDAVMGDREAVGRHAFEVCCRIRQTAHR